MSIRKAVVSGSFYPNSEAELLKYFEHFNKYDKKSIEVFKNIKAIISPHAGYIYSGFTANLAYSLSSFKKPKRVIVVGPSHRVYLKGASIAFYEKYETPLGNLDIDIKFSKELIEKYEFLNFNQECEFEHSTETQMPFIKHYFANAKIVEIIYGDMDFGLLSSLIDELLKDEDNFIVISTDLSHFYDEKTANNLDSICLQAIKEKNLSLFDNCEACGKTGVKAMIKSVLKYNLETKILNYCTSAEVSKDKSRVVGYTSALIGV